MWLADHMHAAPQAEQHVLEVCQFKTPSVFTSVTLPGCIHMHMPVRIEFQTTRNALISDHRQHIMCTSCCKHSSAWTTRRPSPTSSVICMLPWTTALHLARPTPLCARSWRRRWDGLRSGDEVVRVISRVAAKRRVWSRTCVDVRGRCITASRDRWRGCWWECIAASQARQDRQPVGTVEVPGDRSCYPGSGWADKRFWSIPSGTCAIRSRRTWLVADVTNEHFAAWRVTWWSVNN